MAEVDAAQHGPILTGGSVPTGQICRSGGDRRQRSASTSTVYGMADLVPIFPLDIVLLPGAPLPLHIFEPRYRELIADVCAPGGARAFGVVALKDGGPPDQGGHVREVGLSAIGTLAEVIEVEPYPDGRSDLLTIGSRRFHLLDLDATSKNYLRALVEWLPEDDGDIAAEHLAAARALCDRYGRALAALSGREAPEDKLADDPLRLSYQVAARLRLPTADRQRLLEAETAAARLLAAMHLLRRETTLLMHTKTVPISTHVLGVSATSN